MAVTAFGRAVREARYETQQTLSTMSKGVKKSIAFISAVETGRTKIPLDYVEKVEKFFNGIGYHFKENLLQLANVDNQNVPIDHLDYQQQMMVAGFANSRYTSDELKKICSLLDKINKLKEVADNNAN